MAPVITELDQVTSNKLDNFKVVAGVMNKDKPSAAELQLLGEIRAGDLFRQFTARKAPQMETPAHTISDDTPIVIENEESDEEITVIEETETGVEDKIPTEDLKPKDLRSLIMAYNDMVTQHSALPDRGKYDLTKLQEASKIEKPLKFFEDFCFALYTKCENVRKGFKVGHIFVTQAQVKMILNHGIINHKDIMGQKEYRRQREKDHEAKVDSWAVMSDEDLLKTLPFNILRKFIIDFHNFLCGRVSIEQMSKNAGLSADKSRRVMQAVGKACMAAPVVSGHPQGLKVQNIFISATWVQEIQNYMRSAA